MRVKGVMQDAGENSEWRDPFPKREYWSVR